MIMVEWKDYKLVDITDLVIDYRGKTPLKLGSDWSSSGYRALSAKNIKTGQIVAHDSIRYVDEDLYHKWMKDEVKRGDILITSEAPFGQVFYWDSDEKIVLSQRLFCVRIKKEIDSRFVYYYMTTSRFQSEMSSRASGTTVLGLRQPELLKCSISIPSLDIQCRIASILSSLDDKIAVNKKICENLEAQAQALFKHWFVDFAPFKDGKFVESELGLIPEGWRVGYLSDVLDLINETTNQGERPELPYLPIDSIPMNSFLLNEVKDNSEAQSSLLIFKKDDILVGAMRVYFHRVVPTPFDGITRSTCFVLRPKIDDYFSFALCVANSNDAIRYAQKTSKGSTMPYAVWEGGLGSYCTLIPPKSILKDFNVLLKKDIELIQNMYFENNRLATLRDALLPKLMSGQIKL